MIISNYTNYSMINTKPKSLLKSAIGIYDLFHPKYRTHYEIIRYEEKVKSLLHIEIPPNNLKNICNYYFIVFMSNFEIEIQKCLIRDKLRKSHPKIKFEMDLTDIIIDHFPRWDFFFKYNTIEKINAMSNVLEKLNGVLDHIFFGLSCALGSMYVYIVFQSIENYH